MDISKFRRHRDRASSKVVYAPAAAAPPASYYYPSAATTSVLPEAQKVLKLTPTVMSEFIDDLRKTYNANTENLSGLARISSLSKAAQEKYKEFRSASTSASTTDATEPTAEEIRKLDDVVEYIVKDEKDRAAQSNSRYGEGYRYGEGHDPATGSPYPYSPYAPYYYGYPQHRPVR